MNFHVRRELAGDSEIEERTPNDQIIENHINALSYKDYLKAEFQFYRAILNGAYYTANIGTAVGGIISLANEYD